MGSNEVSQRYKGNEKLMEASSVSYQVSCNQERKFKLSSRIFVPLGATFFVSPDANCAGLNLTLYLTELQVLTLLT